MERRLAAILAADVVGYSRLIEADEAGTLVALKSHLEAVIGPKITQYHGRLVKLMGDGLLAEFPSAVEAVQCAVEVQNTMRDRNTDVPEGLRITYRVGINIGDIVVEKEDIFGDGVNVAARLEGLAKPGGICISGNVYEQLGGKIDISFDDIGERFVKNIAKPVAVWRWVSDAAGQVARQLPLPDKPSIAVLPFLNMSGDPEQEFFADGMAEDIISGLSRYRWFFVIARGSSFSYKGRTAEAKAVSQELGVRYLVEGSVRKSAGKLRVTAQLIDAVNGRHIWSERYDRDLKDIFAVQDEITEAIVATIEPELGVVERERSQRNPPDSLDAWSLYQRGLWHFYGDWTRDGVSEAKRLLQRACDLDPGFATAYAELVFVHVAEVIRGFTDDPKATLDAAAVAAEKAVSLDPRDPAAHCALGRVLIYRHSFERAISEMEAALDLSASSDRAYYCLGLALLYGGRPEESIPQFEKAIRLNPRSPMLWAYLNNLGRAYFRQEKYEEALAYFEDAIQKPNVTFMPFAHLAATLSHLERTEDARAMLAELRKREPSFSVDTIQNTIGVYGKYSGMGQIIDGLRKVGLDENVQLADTDKLSISDKPSIAVLPFTNMSGDPEQDYFSDGITEDIITALAHFRDISVIARNSSFAFKGQSPDVTEVGRKLGAQYLVEGSVRKAGDKVRITAQLVDASTGAQIWAHRYDRDLEDIFVVQDDVTETVVGTLAGRLEIVGAERARKKPTTSLTAFDYLLQGRDLLYRFNRKDNAKARELLEKAIALDPDYAEPHAFLSRTYLIDWFGGWSRDLDACLERATEIAKRAIALDDSDSLAQAQMGYVLLYRRQHERARQHIERAMTLNPHYPDMAMYLGLCETWSGNAEVGLAKVKEAMRLDPFGHYGLLLGLVHYSLRNYQDAVAALNSVRAKLPTVIARRAASYAWLGQDEQARLAAEEFLEVASAGMTTCGVPLPESWLDFLAERHPYQRQEDMDHFLDGLRKADLPE